MINHRIFDLVKDYKKRNVGKDVHNEVLTRVMDAPVNLFFDITPIGLIINRIRGDLNVFRGCLLEVPGWLCDMSSHFIYIAILFIAADSMKTFGTILLIYYLIYLTALPMLEVRKNIDRVNHTIHSPVDSYFHETMRGISIVRAFN